MTEMPFEERIEKYRREAMEYAARASYRPQAVPTAANDAEAMLPQGSTVTPEENTPPDADSYAQFLREHPSEGILKVQATAARSAFPVSGATVEVSVVINGEKYVLYNNVTDESGISDDMLLPARPSDFSQNSVTASDSGTQYEVSVYHPAFNSLTAPVTMFDNIKTILPVVLKPMTTNERGGE
ncbi:MAG: hypothetical protein II357_02850 [Clostridia bacterium]|nr:hypothetical protein [Clostridia bacterium]